VKQQVDRDVFREQTTIAEMKPSCDIHGPPDGANKTIAPTTRAQSNIGFGRSRLRARASCSSGGSMALGSICFTRKASPPPHRSDVGIFAERR